MRMNSLASTTSLLIPLLISLVILGGCATSSQRPATGSSTELSSEEKALRLFEVLDVNSDGIVTKEEANSGFKYLIASYDRDSSNEMLAVKPGATPNREAKSKSGRRPTSRDANRAFESLFLRDGKATESVTKEEFKKLIVKANKSPSSDPFEVFYE